jgi:hypothetical protein
MLRRLLKLVMTCRCLKILVFSRAGQLQAIAQTLENISCQRIQHVGYSPWKVCRPGRLDSLIVTVVLDNGSTLERGSRV